MLRTFNCGIGMVLVVSPAHSDAVCAALKASGEQCYVIGMSQSYVLLHILHSCTYV